MKTTTTTTTRKTILPKRPSRSKAAIAERAQLSKKKSDAILAEVINTIAEVEPIVVPAPAPKSAKASVKRASLAKKAVEPIVEVPAVEEIANPFSVGDRVLYPSIDDVPGTVIEIGTGGYTRVAFDDHCTRTVDAVDLVCYSDDKFAPVVEEVVETLVPEFEATPIVERVAEQHTDIRQRAMLVKLTRHRWYGYIADEDISNAVAVSHNMSSSQGSYYKDLLPKSALAKINAAFRNIRNEHERLTLRWNDDATRILSSVAFPEYNRIVRNAIDAIDQLVYDELAAPGASGKTKYEEAKDAAKLLLNGAYRESDYPSLSELRSKFGAEVLVTGIPTGDDFRIDLGAEVVSQIRKGIEIDVENKIAAAMKTLYDEVRNVVSKFAFALASDEGKAIRSTLLKSITNVLDTLPLLNVTGDTRLDAIAVDLRALVSGLDAEGLRTSATLRVATLTKTTEILNHMNDFFA